MEIQSFNQELMTANLLFMRLFNNIRIISGGKKYQFKCVYGNRSRIFKNLENPERNSTYKLPLIVIERTGIQKNNDRLANLNNEIKYRTHSTRLCYDLFTPVPIDISYSVTIVSKYQDHIDRCIGNFIPFFNKDLFVRSEHPKFEGIEYTNQVIMDDSIDFDRPDELDGTQDDFITATCNFTFKTYMFCGTDKAKGSNIKYIVKEILSTYEDESGEQVSSIISVIEDTEYEGFIPQINTIYVGYYPIPLLSTYTAQFQFVETRVCTEISDGAQIQDPWRDCFMWGIDESTSCLTQLSGRVYTNLSGEYETYSSVYPRLEEMPQ